MNLRPLHDWVLIEREPETTELNGLFVPGLPSNKGTVIAIGPKVTDVAVGESIRFNAYAGYVVQGDGIQVTFIHEADISFIQG